ncbi:MAG: hypothetical protein WA977_01795 [Halobacteriota archaeon]
MDIKKKGIGIFIAAILVIAVFTAFPMSASAASKTGPTGSGGTVTVSNNIYDLSVEDTLVSAGVGTYTVSTGAGFPQPNQDILYDGVAHAPWSSYLTVRSYTTFTDYVTTTSGPGTTPGFAVANLDPAVVSVVPTATSVTTDWSTGPWLNMPDWLNITQVTAIEGTTVADSRVRVTTNVTNVGPEPVLIGIRYEWDLMIDGSDDAWFVERNPDGLWTETEIAYTPPTFEQFETTNDPSAPVFSIFGTVTGPLTFTPLPTPPDRFVYAEWDGAYDNAFDYTPVPLTGMDSAVLYYWGNNETKAILLIPGETVSVTEYLYAIPPPPTAVPTLTPIGLIALVGLLSVIAAISISTTIRKKRR